jgi:DNA-binding beta-propeller fold protein YncE
MRVQSLIIVILLAFAGAGLAIGEDAGPLHLERDIPLAGVEGRIDHFSVDVSGKRIFVAALENGTVEIIDIRKGERVTQIKGLKEPQGVFFDDKTGKLSVATARDGKLRAYDGTKFDLLRTIELGSDADNIRYDERANEIWVGYGDGGIAILDPDGKKVGAVALGAHPEAFQIERIGDFAYVNVPKRLGVVVLDRTKRVAIANWGLGGSFANYPMALDEASRRLFVVCRLPARLIVLDTNSGQIVTSLNTVGDADDVFYDGERHLIYVVGGEGSVEVIRQRTPNQIEAIGKINTGAGARTGLFVPQWSRLLVARPHRGPHSAAILVYTINAQ